MDVNALSVKIKQNERMCNIAFPSTLAEWLCDSLPIIVEDNIAAGKKYFIFDFQYTKIIQSPAVACILECAEIISNTTDRSLVICGLSEMNEKIFEMVGLFLYGTCCCDEEQAVSDFAE